MTDEVVAETAMHVIICHSAKQKGRATGLLRKPYYFSLGEQHRRAFVLPTARKVST